MNIIKNLKINNKNLFKTIKLNNKNLLKNIKLNYKKIILSIFLITILDFIFLTIMSRKFKNIVFTIQNEELQFKMYSAIICYIIMIIGFNYFIILQNRTFVDAFLLGLVIYGVYETTTLTIFNKWDWKIAIVDTVWGGLLFGVTSLIISLVGI